MITIDTNVPFFLVYSLGQVTHSEHFHDPFLVGLFEPRTVFGVD